MDIANARLQGPPIDQTAPAPVLSVRVRQVDPTTVRVALSLSGPKPIAFTSSARRPRLGDRQRRRRRRGAFRKRRHRSCELRRRSRRRSSNRSPGRQLWRYELEVRPAQRLHCEQSPPDRHRSGHGGSDVGTMHGGVSEAQLTLDMAKRLREIFVARGWEVKLTRESDVDVYEANEARTRTPGEGRHRQQGRRETVRQHSCQRVHQLRAVRNDQLHFQAGRHSLRGGSWKRISPRTARKRRNRQEPSVRNAARANARRADRDGIPHQSRRLALLTSAAWRQKVAQEIADGIGQYAQEYPAPNQPAQ